MKNLLFSSGYRNGIINAKNICQMRKKAVYKALYHGLLPYFFYEKQRHYDCSYLTHLWINLKYAWRWIRGNLSNLINQYYSRGLYWIQH